MSIASITGFVTAALVLVGIALAVLVGAIAFTAIPFFTRNHQVRVARHEPLVRYYRQLAFS